MTLLKPSINTPAKTDPCFIGVFHTLNQRHAQLYYLKQNMAHFPKLDVAGSSPVSRSIFSITYEDFAHPPNPPFSCKNLIFRYLRPILPT